MSKDYPIPPEEFHRIYSKVPRATIEVIIKSEHGIYLTLRDIDPCKGQWHLPGGTILFGESLLEAVQRTTKREVGIDVKSIEPVGVIEYPSHYKRGLDQPIGITYLVTDYDGEITVNNEATKGDWFKTVPQNMHADQDTFLVENGFLVRS